jgi:Protein of unknown function (DUF2905)
MTADLGKLLLSCGALLLVLGALFLLLGRTGLPIGRLPGDFLIRGKNTTFYFSGDNVDPAKCCAVAGALFHWQNQALAGAFAALVTFTKPYAESSTSRCHLVTIELYRHALNSDSLSRTIGSATSSG